MILLAKSILPAFKNQLSYIIDFKSYGYDQNLVHESINQLLKTAGN
jgi:hypothetical protein